MDFSKYNPQLEKLAELLGLGMKPSHGYTIAEPKPDGSPNPEVVDTPGVFFPAAKGNVTPVDKWPNAYDVRKEQGPGFFQGYIGRQEGGPVLPSMNTTYGMRSDGTPKGNGYFGPLKLADGRTATELSISVNIGGKDIEIPLLVPTLKDEDINHLLSGKGPTEEIINKAVKHAKERIIQGKSPHADEGEQKPLMFARQKGGSVDPALFEALNRNMSPMRSGIGFGQRTSGYGSGPTGTFSTSNMFAPPTPPTPVTPTSLNSYTMKPDALKTEGDLLWEKKQQTGFGSQFEKDFAKDWNETLNLTSRQDGGPVDPEDERRWKLIPEGIRNFVGGIFPRIVPGGIEPPMDVASSHGPAASPAPAATKPPYSAPTNEVDLYDAMVGNAAAGYTPPKPVSPMDPMEKEYQELRTGMKLGPANPAGDEAARARLGELSPERAAVARWEGVDNQKAYDAKLAQLKGTMGPGVVAVTPGYQTSYYEAHPYERMVDEIRQSPEYLNLQKLLETEKNRAQGFGEGFGPTPIERRKFGTRAFDRTPVIAALSEEMRRMTSPDMRDYSVNKPMSEYQAESLKRQDENLRLREETINQTSSARDEGNRIREDLNRIREMTARRPPSKIVTEINDKVKGLDRYTQLINSFDPSYAGSYVLGPTMSRLYERGGVNLDRVNWWKNFKEMDAKLRHEIFGATLTGNEQKAWDQITVSENSNPAAVINEMRRRMSVMKNHIDNDVQGYTQQGWDVREIAPGVGYGGGQQKTKSWVNKNGTWVQE